MIDQAQTSTEEHVTQLFNRRIVALITKPGERKNYHSKTNINVQSIAPDPDIWLIQIRFFLSVGSVFENRSNPDPFCKKRSVSDPV